MIHLLKTPRLRLCPCLMADLPLVHSLWTHEQIRQFLFDDRIISIDEAQAFVEASIANFEQYKYGIWLIFVDKLADDVDAESDQLIGFAGAVPTEAVPSLIYGIHPNLWKRGYAIEAMHVVVDYLLKQLMLPKVIADVDEPNLASIRVLQKLGMVRTKQAVVNQQSLLYFECNLEQFSAISSG